MNSLNKVSIFTPIESHPSQLIELAAKYLSPFTCPENVGFYEIGNEEINGSKGVHSRIYETTWVAIAAKVASYILSCGIFPLIAFMITYSASFTHQFHWIQENISENPTRDPFGYFPEISPPSFPIADQPDEEDRTSEETLADRLAVLQMLLDGASSTEVGDIYRRELNQLQGVMLEENPLDLPEMLPLPEENFNPREKAFEEMSEADRAACLQAEREGIEQGKIEENRAAAAKLGYSDKSVEELRAMYWEIIEERNPDESAKLEGSDNKLKAIEQCLDDKGALLIPEPIVETPEEPVVPVVPVVQSLAEESAPLVPPKTEEEIESKKKDLRQQIAEATMSRFAQSQPPEQLPIFLLEQQILAQTERQEADNAKLDGIIQSIRDGRSLVSQMNKDIRETEEAQARIRLKIEELIQLTDSGQPEQSQPIASAEPAKGEAKPELPVAFAKPRALYQEQKIKGLLGLSVAILEQNLMRHEANTIPYANISEALRRKRSKEAKEKAKAAAIEVLNSSSAKPVPGNQLQEPSLAAQLHMEFDRPE